MFFRSIRYARYFPIFFSLQTINLESLEHLERAYENGGEELFAVLDEAAKQNKLDDLASFLLSQTAFDNQNDFENTVKALFYLAKYDVQLKITTSDHLLELFRGKNAYARFYELNGSFPQFLLPLLDNQQLDLDTRMIIAGDYLIQRVDPNITVETPNLLPAKADLQRALFNGLEQLLHASSEFNRKIYDVYIKNLSSIEKGTRQIIITKEANTAVREFIMGYPRVYLHQFFLRKHPEPSFSGQYFYFDPFFIHYFEKDIQAAINYLALPAVKKIIIETENGDKLYDLIRESLNNQLNNKEDKFFLDDMQKINILNSFIKEIEN
jgi:hypothetical protein